MRKQAWPSQVRSMEWAENTRNTAPDHRVERVTGLGPGRVTEARLTGTDQDVVGACLAGDADAYATIVERYGGREYNIALRITGAAAAAHDYAQEAFIRAYRALHQYDPALPLGAGLYPIATNASLNHLRRWHAHEAPAQEFPASPEDHDARP